MMYKMRDRKIVLLVLFMFAFSIFVSIPIHQAQAIAPVIPLAVGAVATALIASGYVFSQGESVQAVSQKAWDWIQNNCPSVSDYIRSRAASGAKTIILTSALTSAIKDFWASGVARPTSSVSVSSGDISSETFVGNTITYGSSAAGSLYLSTFLPSSLEEGKLYILHFTVGVTAVQTTTINTQYFLQVLNFGGSSNYSGTTVSLSGGQPLSFPVVVYLWVSEGSVFFSAVGPNEQVSSCPISYLDKLYLYVYVLTTYNSYYSGRYITHVSTQIGTLSNAVALPNTWSEPASAEAIDGASAQHAEAGLPIANTWTDYVGVTSETITNLNQTISEGMEGITGAIGTLISTIERFFDFSRPVNFEPFVQVGNTFTQKFPFSLPWDVKNAIQSISSDGVRPYFEGKIGGQDFSLSFPAQMDAFLPWVRGFIVLLWTLSLVILTPRIMGGEK